VQFKFIDLFAGIGGFHGALSAAGGEGIWSSEIDTKAAQIYELNWGLKPAGDIVELTDPSVSKAIPKHDVLAAGFPCQPFSKSGKQQGFRDTTRGTLFFNICQILEARKPAVVFLENVRNLAGPRQRDTWMTIIRELRNLGYRVSDIPTVFSPHLLPPSLGGAPQVRERVFILGTYVGKKRAWAESDVLPVVEHKPVGGFDPQKWDVRKILSKKPNQEYRISDAEENWLLAWDDFVKMMLRERKGARLPGFPLWADDFVAKPRIPKDTPEWKADFLRKNSAFYLEHKQSIDKWLKRWDGLKDFPPSRRKLEWQAQDERSIWDCVIHFRPSGIRVKRATYLPALVAITQTSIYGPERRRISPDEAKLLQGFPKSFKFDGQKDSDSYKQLGNAVSIGAAYYVFRQHVLKDEADIKKIAPELLRAVKSSSLRPKI
jgi:DNA (cytosine-5)-methyltransferase 1